MKRTLYLASLALALIVLPAWHSLWAQGTGNMQTIYSFEAPPGPTYPAAGLIIGPNGTLYGTTSAGGTAVGCGYFNCGTVFELARPGSSGGAWTETTLYNFTAVSGFDPVTGLVLDTAGTLYGWTNSGGCCGFVYKLTPPAFPGGAWAESTVYSFKGPPGDGSLPVGGLAMGANGSLYGATSFGGTYNQGTVFELTPAASPGGVWTLTVLYNFRGDGDGIQPSSGVVIGENGALYGTTGFGGSLGLGAVYRLQLVSGVWEEKVLFSAPQSLSGPFGLALRQNGVIYGQNRFGILKATPPASAGEAWTLEPLYSAVAALNEQQSLAIGASGAIYWTTTFGGTSTACGVSQGCGTLNELIPPTLPGGAWTPVVLHNFTGQRGDGYQPNGGLVVTKGGAVYGTTYYGGDNFFGTVFRYTP